jgi:hypothetical protein
MQRSIVPWEPEFVRESLDAGKVDFGQFRGFSLVRRIAIVNSTPQRPGLSRRAMALEILPGTSCSIIKGTYWRWRLRQKVDRFDLGEKERVVVLFETAAASTQLTNGSSLGHGPVKVFVNQAQRFISRVHSLVRAAAASISWRLNHWPFPEPGQTERTCFQSSGLSRFSGQKGQLRHCSGRASYTVHPCRESQKTQS